MLRTALGLALVTGTPFRITKVRAGRAKPGLLRQHLTSVRAAAQIGGAEVSGDVLGSTELSFRPGPVRAGSYAFSIGSAGSTTLVLQTILPALLRADGPTDVEIEGGTHNPLAPPFEFLDGAFAPILRQMGARLELCLARHGFAPAGGGLLKARVEPATLRPIEVMERGALLRRSGRAIVSALPGEIARRELAVLQRTLGFAPEELHAETIRSSGPGNAVWVTLEHAALSEVFVGHGARGISAERVAHDVCRQVRAYLGSDAPVGPHLADQLLIPMALAGGGIFRTTAPTEHTRTQAKLVTELTGTPIAMVEEKDGAWHVEVGAAAASAM